MLFQKSDGVPVKVRIMRPDLQGDEKKDISVYDFDDDKKDDVGVSPIGAKTSVLGSPTKSPGRSPSAHPLSPKVCIFLVVFLNREKQSVFEKRDPQNLEI